MHSTHFAPRRSRLAATLTLAVATLALAAAAPAQAETGLGSALKNTAIAGTVATWTVAALKGAPFFGCTFHGQAGNDAWGGRVSAAKDSELSLETIGVERHACPLNSRVDREFGIGPSSLSESNIGDRQKGSNFQFSDHFGIGISSADGHWRGGFAFRHISNLSIKTPNDAVDFKGIAIEWTP